MSPACRQTIFENVRPPSPCHLCCGFITGSSWTLTDSSLGTEEEEKYKKSKRTKSEGYIRMMFNEFCETTGLHGWKYLTRVIIIFVCF